MMMNHGIHRIRGMLLLTLAALGTSLMAFAADPAITVSARQRYPWNGLVDINFTITGDAGTKYDTSFTAKDMVGNTNITMQTICKADGSAVNVAKEQLLPGTYNWVWDAVADLPKDFKCDRVTVTGAAEEHKYLYMVIDLSSGANSRKYPVNYLDVAPSGGFNVNAYKTTKLVLRRIPAGTFTMGRRASDYPNATAGDLHQVTLTKDFYVGVFEVTQKQYSLITGSNPSSYKGDMRPVEQTTFNGLRGSTKGAKWPSSSEVDESSVIGKLRTRTGIIGLDLPTEAQWEYACRAGTTTALNSGKNLTSTRKCSNMAAVGRYGYNSEGGQGGSGVGDGRGGYNVNHTKVGSYSANKWGLYDMHGNVWEWCLDWNGSMPSSAVTDPKGPDSGEGKEIRGGCWALSASRCISHYRRANPPNNGYNATGFRLVVNLGN